MNLNTRAVDNGPRMRLLVSSKNKSITITIDFSNYGIHEFEANWLKIRGKKVMCKLNIEINTILL